MLSLREWSVLVRERLETARLAGRVFAKTFRAKAVALPPAMQCQIAMQAGLALWASTCGHNPLRLGAQRVHAFGVRGALCCSHRSNLILLNMAVNYILTSSRIMHIPAGFAVGLGE